MSATRTFDEIPRTSGRPRHKCPRCGGDTTVMVRVDVCALHPQTRRSSRSLRAVSKNMCEPCAVEAHDAIAAAFESAVMA